MEKHVVRLIQDFDLLSADCECLEKEATDEAAIGVAKAAAQNASVPPVIPATGVPEAMKSMSPNMFQYPSQGRGAPNSPPGIPKLERKVVVGREEAEGLTSCHG